MGKGYVNLANLAVSDEARAKVLALGAKIRSIGQVAQAKVNGLSDPNTLWTIGWLFSIMGMVAAKHRQRERRLRPKKQQRPMQVIHQLRLTNQINKLMPRTMPISVKLYGWNWWFNYLCNGYRVLYSC